MAHYLVRARLKPERQGELQAELQRGAFLPLQPFGSEVSRALSGARSDPDTGEAVWEEQCFCVPPLRQERAAVLDRYFEDIRTEVVQRGEGWRRIRQLPPLWSQLAEERQGVLRPPGSHAPPGGNRLPG